MGFKTIVQFLNGTPQLESGVSKFINRAVDKSTKIMERNVKVNTPVREGHLRRSIRSRMTGEYNGEVYNEAIEGGKEINYAVYVEFGTKYMAPRAMFRKGVAMSEDKIKQTFADEAKNVKVKILKNK